MDTLGSLIGPLVTFMCIGIFSMRSIFVLSFFPGFLAVIAILFLTKDLAVPQKSTRISPTTFWQDLFLLPRSFIIFLMILFVFDVSIFNKLLLLARAQEMLTVSTGSIAALLVLLYAIFNISRAFGEFFIGLLSDYLNRTMLLAFLGCGLLALAAFLLITPHASLLYCIGVFILMGISTAATTTLKKACAADMLPADIRGLGYGILQASEGFAALIASALIGFLWTYYSPFVGFSYAMTLSLSAMVLLLGFGAIWKRR
jgi:MFS family permease